MNGKVFGVLIALAVFACIAFRLVEARLGLLGGAMAMFIIAGSPVLWFRSFVDTMGKTEFLKVILPVFSFTSVAKVTGCTAAFINLLAAPLTSWGTLLVPMAVLLAFLTNMALVSATASGLAVGGVLLPILLQAGIDPPLAVASVLAGTWGAVLSPGSKHAALIAEATNQSIRNREGSAVEAMDVVRGHARVVVGVLVCVMALMWLEAAFWPRKPVMTVSRSSIQFINSEWLKAIVPVLPLVLLWVIPRISNAKIARWFPRDLVVLQTMFIGIVLAVIVKHAPNSSAPEGHGKWLADAMFSNEGMAYAYGTVMTMIIAAMVFVAGLQRLGVLDALLFFLRTQHRRAAWYALYGDMAFAALSGSGDAASCSFNLGVTPNATNFKEQPRKLGSMAWLGAEMGRCISPVAVVTLALTHLADGLIPGLTLAALNVVAWTVLPITLAGLIAGLWRDSIKG